MCVIIFIRRVFCILRFMVLITRHIEYHVLAFASTSNGDFGIPTNLVLRKSGLEVEPDPSIRVF